MSLSKDEVESALRERKSLVRLAKDAGLVEVAAELSSACRPLEYKALALKMAEKKGR